MIGKFPKVLDLNWLYFLNSTGSSATNRQFPRTLVPDDETGGIKTLNPKPGQLLRHKRKRIKIQLNIEGPLD